MNITKSAAIKRIRRALAKKGQALRTARSTSASQSLSHHFIVNERNVVVAQHVDLTELGRELRVLTPSETVEAG